MLTISFLSAELAFTTLWLLTRLIVWKRQGRRYGSGAALNSCGRPGFAPPSQKMQNLCSEWKRGLDKSQ